MGLLRYLQKLIASLLRPWILQKDILDPVFLHLHFSQIVLELQPLELDISAINSSSLLASSPFLLRHARLDHAKLTISLFRSPGLCLEVRGLHLVGYPRPFKDSFWSARRKQSVEDQKREAIMALDPQGGAVHAAAESHAAREAASSSVLRTFLINSVLQALRAELHDASVEVHSNAIDGSSHCYSLLLECLVVEEAHGLAGAVIVRLINVLKRAEGSFSKICSIQDLGLQLVTAFEEPAAAKRTAQRRAGLEGHTTYRGISKKYTLLWKRVSLISELRNDQLNGMDAVFTETVIQLNLAEVEALLAVVSQLQGLPSTTIFAHETRNIQQINKCGRFLWQKAVEKITSGSLRRFKDAVEAGVLRHKYTQLYASWLHKAGGGLFHEVNVLSRRKDFRRKKLDLKSIERDLSRMEQELPVEAIVLARSLARRKVLAITQEHGLTAVPSSSIQWDKAVSCLLVFWGALKRACDTLALLLKRVYRFLCVCIKLVLASSGFYWLISKCIKCIVALRNRFPVMESYFASQSKEQYSRMAAECSRFSHKRKWPSVSNTKGMASFTCTFHTCSLTLVGALDYLPVDGFKKFDKGFSVESVKEVILPGVCFTWGNASVEYWSNANKLGLELVCGYVQGEVVTSTSHSYEEAAVVYEDGQGWAPTRKGDGAKFLLSGPAPQISLPERAKDYFKHEDSCRRVLSGEKNFMDSRVEGKDPATSAEMIYDSNIQPFLFVYFKSSHANFITPDKNSDMVKFRLAVGCLDCKLDLGSLTHLGLLLKQFLGVVSVNKQFTKVETYQPTMATSTSSPKGSEWEVLYADWIKRSISAVVLRRTILFSAAVRGPKLQLSGFFVDSKGTGKVTDGVVKGKGSVLVISLGLLEATVWPAKVEPNSLPAEKLENVSRRPWYETKETKAWLRKPPSPLIHGDAVVESNPEHKQIGNNGMVSVQGAVLALQALNDSEVFPLVGPLKMTWEFSLCRDHFLSPFGISDVVSAAATGSFSAIPLAIHLDEIKMLSEALKATLRAFEQFSGCKNHHLFSYKRAHMKTINKSDDWQVYRQADGFSLSSDSSSISSHPQLLYFAVSVEIQVEGFDCVLSDKRTNEGVKTSQEGANIDMDNIPHLKDMREAKRVPIMDVQNSKLSESLGMHGRTIYVSVKELSLEFSWGDGCLLFVSSAFKEANLSIAKIESGTLGNSKEENPFKPSSSWKIQVTVYESAKEETARAHVLSQLSVEQFLFTLKRPWYLSEASYDMDTQENSTLFSKHKNLVLQNRISWMVAVFEVGKLHLTDGASNSLVNKALSRVMGTPSLSIDIAMSNDYESISVISKGGMLVLDTKALSILLQESGTIFCLKSVLMEGVTRKIASTSASSLGLMHESSASAPPTLGRSSSLPLQYTQNELLKQQRLYSAPIESCVDEQETHSRGFPWLIRGFSMELIGMCLLLAQTNSTPAGEEPAGLLLEVDAITKLEGSVKGQAAYFETTRFSVCSVQFSAGQYSRLVKGKQIIHIPKFGSSSMLATRLGIVEVPKDLGDSSNPLITIAKTKHSALESSQELLPSSEMEGLGTERMNDYILENLRTSCRLENNSGYPGQSAWSHGWKGSCSFLGIDVGITTCEIQLLLALFSSLSSLSAPSRNDPLKTSMQTQVSHAEQLSDHGYEVPDGSIVAVKDVHEQLYMAVEKADKTHRLIGVLHYSLVGDRALFKVKYQKHRADSSQLWFSLLSVGAKNADGEPFRVHYRPGSGLADISSTRDGSWELWQTLPYKYSAKEDDGDIDLYGDLYRNLVYLVNQKSKQGLTLASGGPMMVKKPGSPFKLKVLGSAGAIDNTFAQADMHISKKNAQESEDPPSSVLFAVPKVEVKVGRIIFTLLHETGGGKHLLPLLRGRLEDAGAVMHIQSCKIRLMGECKIIFEYLEAHVDKWSMIIQPVDTEIIYGLRIPTQAEGQKAKMAASFFARFKRVDITISETSLDMMLFVIGVLNLAGPYTIKHSPVLATSCLVENHTGLDLCCSFDNKNHKEDVKIPAWTTDTFLVRNMTSRRESMPTKVSSSVFLYLEKKDIGLSSPVHLSLAEPGITAVRTRLESKEGHKRSSGPIIVVDVSKQSQDGIIVTVSPMVRIHNASGLALELRCRRPNLDGEGAVVLLEDGDAIDDSMGAFDAMNLEGELRKALSSFNVGNYLLSIRPLPMSLPDPSLRSANEEIKEVEFDWSEDIKGAKPIRISGFLEKLQYGLRKSLKGRNLTHSFGTVYCGVKVNESSNAGVSKGTHGVHLFIRSTHRLVPVTSMNPNDKHEASRSVVAWQEQQELVLLPTIRVYNLLESKISIILGAASEGKSDNLLDCEMHIQQAGKACMYADLAELSFAVKIEDLMLTSNYISIGDWKRRSEHSSASTPADGLKEMEMELDFGDNHHYVKLKIFRADDGVLQVLVYTQYALKNKSDTTLLCCAPKRSRSLWGGRALWNRGKKMQWPSGEAGMVLHPGGKISLLKRSSYLLLQMAERLSEIAGLDLETFSGSTELSLNICHENGMTEQVQLGVTMDLSSAGDMDPTRTINIGSRYIVLNESQEAIFVCQDSFQEDESAALLLKAGEHVSLIIQCSPGHKTSILAHSRSVGSDMTDPSICSVRFRLRENGWDWTGPVCASALGSFSLRICRSAEGLNNLQSHAEIENQERFKFASIDVDEESPSLIVRFRMQSADTVPYRIENALSQASIFFYQKGLGDSGTSLKPGQVVGYAWDNLSQPHKLVVRIYGAQLCSEISLDKLRPWRSFQAVRQKKVFGLQLPFQNQLDTTGQYDANGVELSTALDLMNVGYEICADGPQRVLRVCEDINSSKSTSQWQSHVSFPSARMDFKVPAFGITLVETAKQKNEGVHVESPEDMNGLSPIISMRMSSLLVEILNTQKHVLFQLKVQTLSVDEKWQGAPFAAMLRVHSEDRFKKGETVLHMAAIISNQASNPIHVKYSSILLQAIDLNLDEETLMKLVPFYRYSLAELTSSRQIYFERFEIHPIKIVGSFLPGQPLADYTSAQETFRALLHSFIKVPSIRGTTVELNGVLLSHALLTFRQLAIKCAQHYSWYAMRAVYIAKGSKLLPPAFASLFDDSAASSLDVFFDPSNGSIDLQGLTLGMFNLLSEGLNKRGFTGTSRYIGDLERTMKTAGSNILFAILTEVSDNVLKGAETGGIDGMVNGFRRGILNLSMEPSLLRSAVVKGGSSRRIKLDRSAGTDETYIEGYLQAMLDTLFKQDYLKVKVVDDQVLLKNLPPNSMLIDEIIGSVKDFLVREGLLAGETSTAAMHSLRRLQGENDKRIVPAVVALCEQLFVIFAVRALRNQARSWFHWGIGNSKLTTGNLGRYINEEDNADAQPEPEGGQQNKRGIKGIMFSFVISSAMAYIDGRLCRHIPNTLARRVVSGFLLSFVE